MRRIFVVYIIKIRELDNQTTTSPTSSFADNGLKFADDFAPSPKGKGTEGSSLQKLGIAKRNPMEVTENDDAETWFGYACCWQQTGVLPSFAHKRWEQSILYERSSSDK